MIYIYYTAEGGNRPVRIELGKYNYITIYITIWYIYYTAEGGNRPVRIELGKKKILANGNFFKYPCNCSSIVFVGLFMLQLEVSLN